MAANGRIMRKKQRDTILLGLMRKHATPITLKALLAQLGEGYSERSLRRWLAEMVQEGLVEKIGEKRATTYQPLASSKSIETEHSNPILTPSNQKINEKIKPSERAHVLKNLEEDLREISVPRIAGLDVSIEQFERWHRRYRSQK